SADIHLAGALNVARMRNSRHEMTMKHLQITDTGITIGAKLEGVTGRLGWSGRLAAIDGPAQFHPCSQALARSDRAERVLGFVPALPDAVEVFEGSLVK